MTSASNRIINSGGQMVNGMMGNNDGGHNVMTTASQQPMMSSQQQQPMRQMGGNNPNINLVNALTGPPGAKMVNTSNGPLLSLGGDMGSGMNNGMMIGGNKPPNMNSLMGMMPGQQQQQQPQQQQQQMRPGNMMVRQAMLPQQFQQRAPNAGGMVQTQPGTRMMNVRLANAQGGPPGSVTMVSGQQFVNASGVQGNMVMTQGQLRPGQAQQLGQGMQQVSTATVNLPPRYPTQLEQSGKPFWQQQLCYKISLLID